MKKRRENVLLLGSLFERPLSIDAPKTGAIFARHLLRYPSYTGLMIGTALTAAISIFIANPAVAAVSCTTPYTEALDYEAIKELVIDCKLKSIDDLLPLLPVQYRKSFGLVYQSNSPEAQAVDPEHPRTVLFGDDAKLLLAFTTNPDKPFYEQLQIIQYRDEDPPFEFYKLEFNGDGTVTENEPPPIKKARHRPYSPPQSCLGCHDEATRPNEDSYRLWPGFYGSDDDDFSEAFNPDITQPELKNYTKISEIKNKGRLSNLIWPKVKGEDAKYAPFRNLQNTHADLSEQGIAVRPNLRLTKLVTHLNAKKVFMKLKKNKLYDKFKYRLAAGLLNKNMYTIRETCLPLPGTDSFEPEAKRLIHDTAQYKMDRMGIKREFIADGDITPNSFNADPLKRISRLLALAKVFKLDPQIYSTGTDPKSFAINDGDQMMDELLLSEILTDIAKDNPAIKKLLKFNYNSDKNHDLVHNIEDSYYASKIDSLKVGLNLDELGYKDLCGEIKKHLTKKELWPLKEKIKTEPADAKTCPPPKPTEPLDPDKKNTALLLRARTLFQPCISCHKQNTRKENYGKHDTPPPRIEFDEPETLIERLHKEPELKKKIYDQVNDGDMPPNRDLSSEEKDAILDFLQKL